MPKLPLMTAKQLIKVLRKLSFEMKRQQGSHMFFEHEDGRTTIVPFHAGEQIDRGLLLKIIKKDLEIDRDEFLKLV